MFVAKNDASGGGLNERVHVLVFTTVLSLYNSCTKRLEFYSWGVAALTDRLMDSLRVFGFTSAYSSYQTCGAFLAQLSNDNMACIHRLYIKDGSN